jgi:hypothetical protein
MRIFKLFACALILSICLQSHSRVITGPPDLTGKWVIKNSDGSIMRHYTAIQNGNYIKFQCTDPNEGDRTLIFNWDVPGNYVLIGTLTGLKFDTYFTKRIKDFYHAETQVVDFRIGSGPYDKEAHIVIYAKMPNGKSVPVTNYDDFISCNVCQTNSFSSDARFSVSESLDRISVSSKNLFNGIKAPNFREDKKLYSQTLYTVDFSGCCDIWSDTDYTYQYMLIKVKDSW